MPPDGRRRNVWFPDDLWAAIVKAAAQRMLDTGEPVSAAEVIREAVAKDLEPES